MKITIAGSAGFCFGVKRALAIALKAAASDRKVYMLGDIVHNEVVVDEMRAAGIKRIKAPLESREMRTLLIRAHGVQQDTVTCARRAGYKIIDATCPMVKEIHAIAKTLEKDNRTVIIIGDKEHDEVRGIVGQLKKRPVIISSPSDISRKTLRNIARAGVVVQSTQEEAKVFRIVSALKRRIRDLAFRNTICNPTRTKQKEARTLPVKNDVVIVVGSKSSANTKRLYQISRSLNRRTYWVNSPGDLRRVWFKLARRVGITAGASTPESSIRNVAEGIRNISV
ncbi:MAG: 4-hydroxy-3-methylbut-2-enyl diphosphate reductase [Candidatus Omnitrophica bacterium]|nr:4-hydroxy-3-methylbut-2-enyl diphosphate reductase [Candidatus Omnitrophota bacterium]MBU1809427.1 4-hydroxy-3-methylbut-2-enyl diphosphate reductase [Candidatus Omnitrophota bacterium]